MSVADLEKLVVRLEAVTGKLESLPSRGSGGGASGPIDDDPEWHDDFVKINQGEWKKFIDLSKEVGDDVAKQAALIEKAFEAHRMFMLVAARFNSPAQKDQLSMCKELSECIMAVQGFRDSNRQSKQFNFLSAISEGIPFLGWVVIAPKPAAYVLSMQESAQFYTNKILKEYRQSDEKLANWSNHWIQLLKNFQSYIKDMHTVGLSWNKDKPAASLDSFSKVSSSGPSAGGAPPPPPPPGPPAPPPPMAPGAPPPSAKGPSQPDTSALFAQINQGGSVTSGLKKVSDDMKTHKNPALKQVSALSPRPYSPPQFKKFTAPGGAKPAPAKKPPMFELVQSKKWIVENQEGNQNMVIDNCEVNQTVYMYKCNNSVLQVKGKVNSITLDSCKKCGIVFEDLIGTCEFVNCQSVKAQANGMVPTISIDKTDGAQIYVNDKSINAQIISAKSSEMNICVTKEDGDLTEYPLAEQFKTVFQNGKYVTTTMDLNL